MTGLNLILKFLGIKGAIYLLHQIIHKHGLSALYDGLETDTGATIISGFLYYYFYSFLRSFLTRRRSPSSLAKLKIPTLSVAEELGLGFAAGLASKLISTPLSVVTVRLQTEREDAEEDEISYDEEMQKVGGVKDVIGRIYEEDGLVGFWRGST
jgi:adenine nucleotide transporter 17